MTPIPTLIVRRDGRGPDLAAANPATPAPSLGGHRGLFIRTASHDIFDVMYPHTWSRDEAIAWLCDQEGISTADVVSHADWSVRELALHQERSTA